MLFTICNQPPRWILWLRSIRNGGRVKSKRITNNSSSITSHHIIVVAGYTDASRTSRRSGSSYARRYGHGSEQAIQYKKAHQQVNNPPKITASSRPWQEWLYRILAQTQFQLGEKGYLQMDHASNPQGTSSMGLLTVRSDLFHSTSISIILIRDHRKMTRTNLHHAPQL